MEYTIIEKRDISLRGGPRRKTIKVRLYREQVSSVELHRIADHLNAQLRPAWEEITIWFYTPSVPSEGAARACLVYDSNGIILAKSYV